MTTTRNDNITLARQLLEHFLAGDIDGWLGMLAPDVYSRPSVDGRPELHGRDEVAQWWSQFSSLDGELEPRIFDYEPVGDCVIIRGYLRQREGRTLSERQLFWLYEFRDGLAVRVESHPTRSSALAASAELA